MKLKTSKTNRRIGIFINWLCLVSIILIWENTYFHNWNATAIIFEALAIALLIISFIIVFVKTDLWRFTHTSIHKQDERELKLTGNSLRIAYSIFTIIALSILLVHAVIGGSVSIILAVSLIYVAHILPAAILAWKETSV